MNTLFWFCLSFFFIILEISHPGLLYFLALASGSGVACLISWFEYSSKIQEISFFIASVVAIGVVYFLLPYFIVPDTKFHRSNIDLLIGKMVTIIEIQSQTTGLAKIGGETWLVKLQGDGELSMGMKVIVIGVQGCHLQVKINA